MAFNTQTHHKKVIATIFSASNPSLDSKLTYLMSELLK